MRRNNVRYRCVAGLAMLAALSIPAAVQSGGHSRTTASLRAAGLPDEVVTTVDRACLDCHSGDTHWPWYARLPFIREQIQTDVANARQFLDFSNWANYTPGQRLGFAITMGNSAGRSMPPRKYVWAHWTARVADSEREALQRWAKAERARMLQARARARNASSR